MVTLPKSPHHLQLNIRLSPELNKVIEDFRKQHEQIPSRSDVVKLFMVEGMRVILGSDELESILGTQEQEQEIDESTETNTAETEPTEGQEKAAA
jgi:hypothetical protein